MHCSRPESQGLPYGLTPPVNFTAFDVRSALRVILLSAAYRARGQAQPQSATSPSAVMSASIITWASMTPAP